MGAVTSSTTPVDKNKQGMNERFYKSDITREYCDNDLFKI